MPPFSCHGKEMGDDEAVKALTYLDEPFHEGIDG